MRMPKKPGLAPAEGNKSRKVHPQLPGSKECGCPISQILEMPGGQRREKCIRNCQKARDADAQKARVSAGGRKQIKKSASATARKQGMRMPKQTNPGKARRTEARKVHPQLPGSKGCGCTNGQKDLIEDRKARGRVRKHISLQNHTNSIKPPFKRKKG